MTTLIVTGKGFYSDGRSSVGGEIVSDSFPKVFKYKGRAVGLVGTSGNGFYLAKALIDGDSVEEFYDEDVLVLIHYEGVTRRVHYEDGKLHLNRHHGTECFGSGGQFARAALDFGKSPKKAIKYAMTRDVYTGGTIHKILFKDLES